MNEIGIFFVCVCIVLSIGLCSHYRAEGECAKAGLVQKVDPGTKQIIWAKP
ncbi:MAG: hypothetical protein WC869_00660 [Phycisphaerae bacterium]|jgi:hypothetical protein